MNGKLVIYSVTGCFVGTVLSAIATTKTFLPTSIINSISLAQGQSNSSPPATPPFGSGMMGQSDRHFIVMMIPHHQDAVEMAELAFSKAKHPEIKELAEAIKTTQTQEIEQMRNWYKEWYGTDVPAFTGGMGMGMHGNWNGNNTRPVGRGGGCMGTTDLSALENSSDFDREFIEQMIPHHQMAVHMAYMVLNSSQHSEIRTLAESIIKSQSTEIEQMQKWYQNWYQ